MQTRNIYKIIDITDARFFKKKSSCNITGLFVIPTNYQNNARIIYHDPNFTIYFPEKYKI